SFIEAYRREWFPQGGEMVQANRADRAAGCLVGLHYHLHQSDYWYVLVGTARVVLHDLRVGSPTDGATQVFELGARPGGGHDHRGVFIPPGVAHGFAAITDMTIAYLVGGSPAPNDGRGVAGAAPAVRADWGVTDPVLSKRDQTNPPRADLSVERRPRYAMRV